MMSDRPRPSVRRLAPLVTVLIVGALTGCGADGADVALSEAGERGRDITRSNGCAACHGSNGEGGVGPSYVGLFGSERELTDGSTVTADREYLRESITDPAAKQVEGFGVQMPSNDLSEDEVDAVIDYIVELADGGSQGAADADLPPAARRGAQMHRANGCAACHGAGGEGGVGGPYVGLFGAERELVDGTAVVADRAYLLESITDPDAKRVEGADGEMPDNDLSTDEAAAIVDYIEALADEGDR